MTRALAITEREARTLLRAAEKERAVVEVKVGDKVFRLIPECLANKDGKIDDGQKGYL